MAVLLHLAMLPCAGAAPSMGCVATPRVRVDIVGQEAAP